LKNNFQGVNTMRFKVKLKTKDGRKREIEIDATSLQDAREQVNETYKGCTIHNVDLMPKAGYIRLYSHGEQTEAPVETIYEPF
jgi:hypothetical protein